MVNMEGKNSAQNPSCSKLVLFLNSSTRFGFYIKIGVKVMANTTRAIRSTNKYSENRGLRFMEQSDSNFEFFRKVDAGSWQTQVELFCQLIGKTEVEKKSELSF